MFRLITVTVLTPHFAQFNDAKTAVFFSLMPLTAQCSQFNANNAVFFRLKAFNANIMPLKRC